MLVIAAGITGIGAFPQASAELSGEIQIGAIAPLSGDWSTNGIQNNVANKVAVDDFNAYLEAKGASWSLMLVTEDSQTVPTVSLEKIQAFNAKNIKHVIGPQTSGSLQNIKGYVDSNNMLIISCCSTSPLLAIPDDSVFRLVPDDSNQAIAISKLLDETGIEVVVPVWRNDAWGMGLHDALANSFSGTVSDGISYNPEGSEFSVEASLLADIVQEHIDTHGAGKVGVVYIGFAEAIPFFQSSAAHDVLNNVRWFGSDGSAKESGFINDPDALQFSTNTEFTAVVVASGQNELSQRVETAVEAEIGVTPTAYASASYDAIWLLGLSMERTQSTDVDVLTEIIPEIANEHMGALGSLTLNSVGDLAQANYEMWTVADNAWQYAGVYDATADSIEFAAMDNGDAMVKEDDGDAMVKEDDGDAMVKEDDGDAMVKEDDGDAMVKEDDGDAMVKEDDGDAMVKEDDGDAMVKEDDGDAMVKEDDGDAMVKEDDGDAMEEDGGGCLIATAAYGSELAPQVQFLREIRDSTLLSTASGASFMTGFNQVYYSFSPAIADLERENPIFRDMVRAAITPAMYTMNIMTLADPGSEVSVLVFGMLSIGAIAGIYVAGPYLTVRTVSRKVRQSRSN